MLRHKLFNQFIKPLWLAALVLLLALTACSPEGLPDTGGDGTPENSPPQAVLEVVNRLSQELGITVEEIEIVEFEQVEWPDSCLGVPQEGQACAQVITPGFRVVLEANGQQYEFRSDQEGIVIMPAPASETSP